MDDYKTIFFSSSSPFTVITETRNNIGISGPDINGPEINGPETPYESDLSFLTSRGLRLGFKDQKDREEQQRLISKKVNFVRCHQFYRTTY